jgi:uncharacterized protein (TIGR02001 family)
MKRLPLLLAVSSTAASLCASAADWEFPASVALTTDYRFRGISQTDLSPAIQGSLGVTHKSGFYAGVWGSNLNFKDNNEATVELDFSAGFRGKYGPLDWDLGMIFYDYPGAASSLNYNYFEAGPKFSHDFGFASTTVGAYFSPNFFGDTGFAAYPSLDVSVPVMSKLNLGLHVGYQTVDASSVTNYTDWKVGLSTELVGLGFELDYIDTSLDTKDCAGNTGITSVCGPRAVFTVSKSF